MCCYTRHVPAPHIEHVLRSSTRCGRISVRRAYTQCCLCSALDGLRFSRLNKSEGQDQQWMVSKNVTCAKTSSMSQVTIRNNETVLIADAANREEIDARVAQIKKELAETDSTYDQEKLSERIAKLAGGVAVIKVCCILMSSLRFTSTQGLGGLSGSNRSRDRVTGVAKQRQCQRTAGCFVSETRHDT